MTLGSHGSQFTDVDEGGERRTQVKASWLPLMENPNGRWLSQTLAIFSSHVCQGELGQDPKEGGPVFKQDKQNLS